MPEEITLRMESVEPWQPIGCIACLKPAVHQETVFRGSERLNVSVRHCGDPSCKEYAAEQARGIAERLEADGATFR